MSMRPSRDVALVVSLLVVPVSTWAEVRELCGGGFLLSLHATNARAQAVGEALLHAKTRAVLCQAGALQELGTLGGDSSSARDVNQAGQIAGSSTLADGTTHPFLWSGGKLQDLGTLGTGDCRALRLDDEGRVAGTCDVQGAPHAFLWERGAMRDLGTLGGPDSTPSAIGPGGQVVGWSTTASGRTHAFRWQGGTLSDLGTLGGDESRAVDVNASGWITGSSTTAAGETHAFLWGMGNMSDLGTLGGGTSQAVGLDDSTRVAGSSLTSSGETHAFVWSAGTMQDLGAFAPQPDPLNPTLAPSSQAQAQNELGEVTGRSVAGNACFDAFLASGGRLENLTPDTCYTVGIGVNELGEVIVSSGQIVIHGLVSVVQADVKAHRLLRYYDVGVANRSIGAAGRGPWGWFRIVAVRRWLARADQAVAGGDVPTACALLKMAAGAVEARPGGLTGPGAARLDGLIANLSTTLACP